MATVSPEISSAAELLDSVAQKGSDIMTYIRTGSHYEAVRSRSHFSDELPSFLNMKSLPER